MAKTENKDIAVKVYVEKISNLIHSNNNPRTIRSKQHQELMKSLKEFPEMKLLREIVVDENLLILAGDKRTFALEELGYTDVTIKQVTGLTDKQKREFIAKDNVHNGEWDTDIIANQWDADELEGWGVPKFKMPGGDDGEHTNTSKDREVICPNCEHVFPLSESLPPEE